MDYEEDFVCGADHTSSRSPSTETESRVQWPHSAIKPVVAAGLTAPTFVLNSSLRKLVRPSVNSNSATQNAVRRCLFLAHSGTSASQHLLRLGRAPPGDRPGRRQGRAHPRPAGAAPTASNAR